jgi:hypothetical protein
MHKFYFSIRTRDGLPVARLMILGRDRTEAERKLKQMYRHCEIISCESSHHSASTHRENQFAEGLGALFAKKESPTGKYPTI